jgi:hypothetical protein
MDALQAHFIFKVRLLNSSIESDFTKNFNFSLKILDRAENYAMTNNLLKMSTPFDETSGFYSRIYYRRKKCPSLTSGEDSLQPIEL